jgi:putative transposase
MPQGGCGVKLHVVWNVRKHWISDFRMTGYRRNDIVAAKKFLLLPSKIYVFDRAYVDLDFWIKITKAQSDFVTRLKKHPRQKAVWKCVLTASDQKRFGVLWQGEWTPSETACQKLHLKTKQIKYRHIIYREPEKGRIFDFITSNWSLPASEIAEIYKKRWAVELLFRWLKQNLDIRSLASRNPNAVRIYLDVAVLIQLLMQLNKLIHNFKGTLSELINVLRAQLYKKTLPTSPLEDLCPAKTPIFASSTG